MPDNDREFIGLSLNEMKLLGRVVGEPTIFSENSAYLTLRTAVAEKQANGQWAETIIDIPVFSMETNVVSRIQQYVQDGRELMIDAYYKAWNTDQGPQHGFFIKKMQLGRKKWIPQNQG